MTTALFKNIERTIIANVIKCRKELKIAVAWFTNPKLFDVVNLLLDKGVNVIVIVADDRINFSLSKAAFKHLIERGAEVRITRSPNLMHHKFYVIDGRLLINGSYNWTRSAELNNHENIMVSSDLNLIEQFSQEFTSVRKNSTKLTSIREADFTNFSSQAVEEVELQLEPTDMNSKSSALTKEEDVGLSEEAIQLLDEAELLYLTGKYDKSLQLCERILRINPRSADTFELMASCKWRQNKSKEQIELAKKAIELDNLLYAAYNTLAIGYSDALNAQKSIENYRICIAAEPENYTYYRNRAISYIDLESDPAVPSSFREKFAGKANEDLNTVIKLTNEAENQGDNYYGLYYTRGLARLLLNQHYPAKLDLLKAMALYDQTPVNERDVHDLKTIKRNLKELGG